MGRASTQVDADGLVCALYNYEEKTVAKNMHRAFIVEEDPVWVQDYGVVIHVVRDLVKAPAWSRLGVVVVFVVVSGVIFCISIDLGQYSGPCTFKEDEK